jgi:hypothetical protein
MNRTSATCDLEFVANGGLRMLKRWIKSAELEGNIEELRILVKLCKKLPFDTHAIKVTEIGKTIKKLLKFNSGDPAADSLTHMLHDEVKELMSHWMNLASSAAPVVITRVISQAESKVLESVDLSSESVTMETEEEEKRPEVKKAEKLENPPAVLVHINRNTSQPISEENKVSTLVTASTITPLVSGVPPVVFPKLNIIRVSEMAPSTSQLAPSSVLLGANRSAIAGVARSSRKPTDMAEGARKLLAMRAQAQTDGNGAKDAAATETIMEVILSILCIHFF